MDDNRRVARLKGWAAEIKKNPDVWAAANAAAGQATDAIVLLMQRVGNQVAADFLRLWAEVLVKRDRRAARRKSSGLPTITGRRARNEADDFFYKMILLGLRGPNIKSMSVSDLARWKARRDNISFDAARRHLTRLKREAEAEAAAAPRFECLTETDQPNILLRLAGIRAPKVET